jgi:hypothetical protein
VEAPLLRCLPHKTDLDASASVRSAALGALFETSGMDKGARKIMITQELDPQDGREGTVSTRNEEPGRLRRGVRSEIISRSC